MAFQPVKFYQTGTFTVGNRLLPPEERAVQANMRRTNSLNSGHRACQGCGEALGARYAVDAAMQAADKKLIAANATGCLEVFSTPFPETSWQVSWIHSLFGNAPAVASISTAGNGTSARRTTSSRSAYGRPAATRLARSSPTERTSLMPSRTAMPPTLSSSGSSVLAQSLWLTSGRRTSTP